jgi:hypothetical protein
MKLAVRNNSVVVLLTMLSMCRKTSLAFVAGGRSCRHHPVVVVGVGPYTSSSMLTILRGGSSDAAVADAPTTEATTTSKQSSKSLYQELLKKLETITHLGK